jgi:hypothetical protein
MKKQISAEQSKILRSRMDAFAKKQPRMLELREKLLGINGCAVVVPQKAEPKLEALLARGTVFDGRGDWMKMAPSACHWNVSYLWLHVAGRPFSIGTGYALSEDGLWRQHSWAMDGDKIVETTVPRHTYFGIVLNPAEADRFASANGPKKKSDIQS